MSRSIVLLVLSSLIVLACGDPEPTQLVVLINSDLQPGTELAFVHVAIDAGADTVEQDWKIVRRAPGQGEAAIPFSFGIKPPGGDAGVPVDIRVSGLAADRHTLVRRRVRVGFVAHQLRLLEIDLRQDCADRFAGCEQQGSASEPKTCVDGQCTSIDVDVRDLPRIDRGEELADAHALPWHCLRGCDAGSEAGVMQAGGSKSDDSSNSNSMGGRGGTSEPMDAADSSTGGMDGSIDGGPDAALDSGHDAGNVVPDAGPDATPGDEPEPPPSGCGPNHGFFADVARPLTKTADGVSCVTFAQNRLDEKEGGITPTLETSTAMLHTLIDKALDAELDVIELFVSQEPTPADPGDAEVNPASLLHATGRYTLTTLDPLLGETLEYPPLRDSNRPLRLLVTDQIASADELAYALLSLLLDKQASAAGGYATECRPVYIMADTDPGKISLLALQMVLANDPMFASLRGHIHFGGHTAGGGGAESARGEIDRYSNFGFEFVDVEYWNPSLIPLVRYARAKGLQVFARETLDIGLPATLCGLVDGLVTPFVSYNVGPASAFRIGITSSRTLVDIDVAELAPDATAVSYSVPPVGTTDQRTLGAGTPTLVSGAVSDALPGTALAFDASAHQSLALNDALLPQGQKLAVLAVLQLNSGPLPSGPMVIASKRQGSTGWALELVDAGAGTKQVRFDSFVRFPDDSIHVSQASITADAFDPSEIQHVLVGFNLFGTMLRFRGAPEVSAMDADFGYTIVDNDAPITLGSDPGAATGFFDGKLQLLKVISYTY